MSGELRYDDRGKVIPMAPALKILGVRSGALIGTIELTDSGELCGSSPGVMKDIKRMAASRGWSPREAFEGLNGWSNGYVRIVASEDQQS
jgi:hypothetical protein